MAGFQKYLPVDLENNHMIPHTLPHHTRGEAAKSSASYEKLHKEHPPWGSNPRPMAHKTIALTTELRELQSFYLLA